MKRILATLIVIAILSVTAFAESNVIYSGNSGHIIFEPGSKHSPTDLFTEFKSVMPGDSLTQTITIRNRASDLVKAKVFIRALGAQEDSYEFLSQLRLRVEKVEDKGSYMFDANADQSAQLTEWYYLGTIYSGGKVDINVILDVPKELDNTYADRIGYLDWEFIVEEQPTELADPKPGGDAPLIIMWSVLGLSVVSVVAVILIRKRKKEENNGEK